MTTQATQTQNQQATQPAATVAPQVQGTQVLEGTEQTSKTNWKKVAMYAAGAAAVGVAAYCGYKYLTGNDGNITDALPDAGNLELPSVEE